MPFHPEARQGSQLRRHARWASKNTRSKARGSRAWRAALNPMNDPPGEPRESEIHKRPKHAEERKPDEHPIGAEDEVGLRDEIAESARRAGQLGGHDQDEGDGEPLP